MKITKAVIPVAGKGTRFLPATKQIPKEMIPIVNKPMIHYVVQEAVDAGIEQIIFVTSSGKSVIEDYFDRNIELETFLDKAGKESERELIKNIGQMIEVTTVRQKEQLGLGHAINCARSLIGDENFAVLLGDDVVVRSEMPVTRQLINKSKHNNYKSVIGVMEVDKDQTNKYGIVDGTFLSDDGRTLKMSRMMEKPDPSVAPTNLATPGRYILTPQIFDCLSEIPRGVGGEYQLTDAINMLAEKDEVYAHVFDGERFDTGSLKGYLDATIEFAMDDPGLESVMKSLLKEKVEKYGL